MAGQRGDPAGWVLLSRVPFHTEMMRMLELLLLLPFPRGPSRLLEAPTHPAKFPFAELKEKDCGLRNAVQTPEL